MTSYEESGSFPGNRNIVAHLVLEEEYSNRREVYAPVLTTATSTVPLTSALRTNLMRTHWNRLEPILKTVLIDILQSQISFSTWPRKVVGKEIRRFSTTTPKHLCWIRM
uniref:Uncharacterized protein n=1 Tax=Rhabditophanes sp. KR3021 TaxID=114890 RepID=A0AC35THF1_9BILA